MLTESQVLGAVTDAIMAEINGLGLNVEESLSSNKPIEESQIIKRVNKIFDEVEQDAKEFEESYKSTIEKSSKEDKFSNLKKNRSQDTIAESGKLSKSG